MPNSFENNVEPHKSITAEELVGSEWAEWYMMTPQERWAQTETLWATYLELGGSLDPEPDTQKRLRNERLSSRQ